MSSSLRVWVVALGAASGSCALFTLDAPCVDDSHCPFDRVCSAGVCVVDVGEGEGDVEGEGEGDVVGEGEGEGDVVGEGEGEGDVGCTGTVRVTKDLVVPGDEADLDPAGNACVLVTGRIEVSAVADLSALSRVRTVSGDLIVRDTDIVDFTGAEVLESVGGVFNVRDNALLQNFDGLEALIAVGSTQIDGNPGLSVGEINAFEARF